MTDAPTTEDRSRSILALNTKVEDDFVAPLAAVRGALEILRDFPDLEQEKRQRFIETALRSCARLEISVEHLADSAYAAGQEKEPEETLDAEVAPETVAGPYDDRISEIVGTNILEIDFSDFVFSSSDIVDQFYDAIEAKIAASGHDWYFLVNYLDVRVWPEAWIAFAHRGEKINATSSLGTVHYVEHEDSNDKETEKPLARSYDPNLHDTRDQALAAIEQMKRDQTE